MIDLRVLQRKSKLPEADYILDKSEKFLSLLEVLTPKFKGNWEIILVDFRVVEVKHYLDTDVIPDYVNCHIYLNQVKVDAVLLDYPKMAPKDITPKDAYKEMIAGMKHLIDKKAMWLLYNSVGANLSLLQESLDKLDAECEGLTITEKQVKSTFAINKRVYASDVLAAFLHKDRYRWYKFDTLVKELGEEYAYNALYKQAKDLLLAKNKYLHNEDVKNRQVNTVDAPLICYVYVVFANSSNWRDLRGIMYSIDTRCKEALERSQYVNLQ